MVDQSGSNGITFRALQLANEQRSAYGLRYSDYSRYRKHCANRTHRLRSSLKMTHGKGRDFKKLPVITTENITNGHLHLLLFETERAWAYAQDLIFQSLKPSNEAKASTLRHTATGRFRRAINWSTQLLSHCQTLHSASPPRISASQLLEVTIYTLILNGRFLRYRDDFESALIQLSVARGLLDEVAESMSTSRDQALAVLFADEIGPEIRYCAHEMRREKAYDVDGIVKEFGAKYRDDIVQGCGGLVEKLKAEAGGAEKRGARKKLETLVWEGKPVSIRNPELVDVLLKVQEAEARLESQQKGDDSKSLKENASKKAVAAYDATLSALSDAEEVARKLVEAQQASGSTGSSNTAGGRDTQFVHAFIVYQLLSRRIQRDLLLISALLSTSSKPVPTGSVGAGRGSNRAPKQPSAQVDSRLYPAIVKLLDTVLQSLNQMRTLSIVDDSPDLASAVEARTTYIKTRRCLFLARCYVPLRKYAEALTLVHYASIHVRETTSTLSLVDVDPVSSSFSTSSTSNFFPLSPTDIKDLESTLTSEALQLKRDWFAHNGGSTDPDAGKTHKKPLFFNIALNYVELDMDNLLQRAGKESSTPASSALAAEKKLGTATTTAKSKKVEDQNAPTSEPEESKAKVERGGLSSLLGGWWGKS